MKNIILLIMRFMRALIQDIMVKRVMGTASKLTYSTLLAFVPIMAVVFAIARGFGYSVHIEEWFRSSLSSQPDAANTIIGFVNSYLVHTQKGWFLGIGLVFMLWTVLMLISNIELAFNDIWQVKKQRSVFRTITDYTSLLFFLPIVIVISSGLSIWIAAISHQLSDMIVIGPMMSFFIKLSPYLLWSLAFTALYVFMPNTKVYLKHAILPGIAAGVCMQIFQLIYINSQIWISSYNAVYGSFAIIPFFLLWLQSSWIICLVGAELSFCRQNSEDFIGDLPHEPSFNDRTDTAWQIMLHVMRCFMEATPPPTAMDIKLQVDKRMRTVSNIIYDLQRINFLAELSSDEKGEPARYMPAQDIANITHEKLYNALANLEPLVQTN